MIKLKDGLYVSAAQISRIETKPHVEYVVGTLADGEKISVPPDYQKSKFDKQEELVAAVRAEALGK